MSDDQGGVPRSRHVSDCTHGAPAASGLQAVRLCCLTNAAGRPGLPCASELSPPLQAAAARHRSVDDVMISMRATAGQVPVRYARTRPPVLG